MKEKILTLFKRVTFEDFFVSLFTAYLFVHIGFIIEYGKSMYMKETLEKISLPFVVVLTVGAAFGLLILFTLLHKAKFLNKFVFLEASVVYGFLLIFYYEKDFYFTLVVLGILFIITLVFFKDEELQFADAEYKKKLSDKAFWIVVITAFAGFAFYMGMVTIMRYRAFAASTFDFGLFAQMFENMAKTGLMNTTLERNVELSHFAVHFSPVYYLLLPFYMVFRAPEFLLAAQAVIVGAAVFPLMLLCKELKLKNEISFCVAAMYLLSPAMAGGTLFDFHENIFLPLFLFFLFYFVQKDKPVPMYVFALLTICVKEDAFLYVLTVGLFLFFNKKKRLHGIIFMLGSLACFMAITAYIRSFGLGIMDSRFSDYLLYEEDTLLNVVFNVLKNPGLLVQNLFRAEKLTFVLQIFLPVGFICFMGSGLSNLYLLVPFLIINLSTNYFYQFQIGFQYIYGSVSFVFVMAVLNADKIKKKVLSVALTMGIIASLFMFTNYFKDEMFYYQYIYANYHDVFNNARELLKQIPSDATVSVSTYIAPQMLHVEKMYVLLAEFDDLLDYNTEYMVIDQRVYDESLYTRILRELKDNGYEKIDSGDFIDIFKKKEQ